VKVLQLGKYYHPYRGGMETHLQQLCERLAPRVDLDVVVSHTEPRTVVEHVGPVKVTRCLQAAHLASTSLNPSLPWVLSRARYDVLHVHFPNPMGVMAYLASRKPRHHRVVITYHSDIIRQERLLKLYAPFMHRVMDRADAILCTSPDYIDGSPTLGRYREKCRVVPLGIDPSPFAPTEATLRRASELRARLGGPLVLGVGRLIYYKGFEYLVEALRSVDARLVLVGEGPLRAELEAKARALGVAERVHFAGGVSSEELPAYFHACDVFALPSVARSEAFGLVQLEAMACGKPVVNTALDSGVPFVSRHGESGLTVAPKDPAALADALRGLFADPARARAMGEAGRARVEREFTLDTMAARTFALYEEVCGLGPAASQTRRRMAS
jgi:rhamnosyl/mannosyltransferase